MTFLPLWKGDPAGTLQKDTELPVPVFLDRVYDALALSMLLRFIMGSRPYGTRRAECVESVNVQPDGTVYTQRDTAEN